MTVFYLHGFASSPKSTKVGYFRERFLEHHIDVRCPDFNQPDFATIRVRYVPDQHLLELKAIKLYIWSYRNEGAFHEDVTNRILNDFVAAAAPRWIEVIGDFTVRGGIKTVVRATHGKRPEL